MQSATPPFGHELVENPEHAVSPERPVVKANLHNRRRRVEVVG
jgi:hypothetical protein